MRYDFETWVPREGMSSIKYIMAKKRGAPKGIMPLTIADMEFRTAPEIVDAVKEIADIGLYGYGGADGELLKAVTGWMQRRHGWKADKEDIVPAPGIINALHVAIGAFTQPGDRIVVHTPNYPSMIHVPKKMGREVAENALVNKGGRYELDLDGLRAKAKGAKMMLLCSPHNPCGRVWTREELLAMAEICRQHDILLFVDEIHCDFAMPGFKQIAFGTLPKHFVQNAIIATSASKTFSLGGLATSFIFIKDKERKKKYIAETAVYGQYFTSLFGAVASKAGFEKGGPWVDEMLQVIWANYNLLKEFIENCLPKAVLTPLEGTYLAWLDCRPLGLTKEERQALLVKAEFYPADGADYGPGGEGFIRINLACPTVELERALKKLENVVRNIAK